MLVNVSEVDVGSCEDDIGCYVIYNTNQLLTNCFISTQSSHIMKMNKLISKPPPGRAREQIR